MTEELTYDLANRITRADMNLQQLTVMAQSHDRELKSLVMKVDEEIKKKIEELENKNNQLNAKMNAKMEAKEDGN